MVEGLIVGDQMPHNNRGVITDRVRESICRLALEFPDKIFYADSRTRIGKYHSVIIKPNRFEAKCAVDPDWAGKEVEIEEAKRCGAILAEQTEKPLYTTVGEYGILVFYNGGVEHVPTISIDEEIDPVGAGDSVSSGIVPTLCGSSPTSRREGKIYVEAAEVGNLVASITITKIGTTGTATQTEVIERFKSVKREA